VTLLGAGLPLGLLLSTSLRHIICFYGWINGTSSLSYALGMDVTELGARAVAWWRTTVLLWRLPDSQIAPRIG